MADEQDIAREGSNGAHSPNVAAPRERDFGAPGGEGARYAGAPPETEVWRGHPSQWTNFPVFVLCALLSPLILPLFYVAWIILETRSAAYILTTERLRTEKGVLSKKRDELELYRVRDIETRQTFWQRLVGVGSVVLTTSDRTDPVLTLPSVKNHGSVADLIRSNTEAMRRVKRVRELDVE